MSAQTGIEVRDGPTSGRLRDRVRHRVAGWRDEPNPLWMREMRQAARVQVTPIALAVLTVLMTVLLGAIGGIMGETRSSPADAGQALFQTFFSLAYFVVALIGPALGANTIASEREGHTWEAVLLTGMRPEVVTRGKFLAAYTLIAMYIVMLAPVGALPFLFGGVTPTEVLFAFVLLFALALVAVGFGLAVSAKMQSTRGALVIALLTAVPLSGFCFSIFGVGGAEFARGTWGDTLSRGPIWLPRAYAVAPFDLEYLLYLVVVPLVVLGLPAWFLYETSLANLTSVTEDRSFGLKRWHAVSSAICALLGLVPLAYLAPHESTAHAFAPAGVGVLAYAIFAAYLFATEPIGASRRMERVLEGRSRLRRWFGPGVPNTLSLLRWTTRGAVFVSLSAALLVARVRSSVSAPAGFPFVVEAACIGLWGFYVLGFTEFVFGLSAWLRARASGGAGVRPILLAILFATLAGPWVIAAITGLLTSSGSDALIVAAPSPLHVLTHTFEAVTRGTSAAQRSFAASSISAVTYYVLGLALARVGRRRCDAIVTEHRALLADADARLAKEDEAAANAAAANAAAANEAAANENAEAAREPSLGDPRSTDRSA